MHTDQPPRHRLADLRTARGLSVMEVAAACGVYPSTVSRWEAGLIPQERFALLADLLGVTVPVLLGYADPEPAEAAA